MSDTGINDNMDFTEQGQIFGINPDIPQPKMPPLQPPAAAAPTTQPLGVEGDRFASGGGLTPNAPGDQPTQTPVASSALGSGNEPGYLEAQFHLNNDVVSAFDYLSQAAFPPDPTYNPLDDPQIKGTAYEQNYLGDFVGSRSAAESGAIIGRINQELSYRDVAARGGLMGWLAGIGAGYLSPLSAIPVFGWLKGGLAVGRATNIALRAAETGILSGAVAGAQGGILQATQETHTTADTEFAVLGSALVSGVLGGASEAR